MPLRSLNSSLLVWPDRHQVDRAIRQWATDIATIHPEIRRLGYFGSYARGDWGVGSDIDLIAIVASVVEPFERRPLDWELIALPVPAEILVYTESEWQTLAEADSRFAREVGRDAIWVFPR